MSPKSFDPAKDVPDLFGKVIFVTGGSDFPLNPGSFTILANTFQELPV